MFTLDIKDREDISGQSQLNDKIIDAAQKILLKQFTDFNGFQPTCFKQNLKHFKTVNENMVQILHRGDIKNGHWFTISTVGCKDGNVNWFDSIYSDLDGESKNQICSIVNHSGKQVKFHRYPVQNQIGASDCGLFAIAFAVSICLGSNPSKFIYEQDKMRAHLIDCLLNPFNNFPFSVNTNWKKRKISTTRENVFCNCRSPYDSEMVECIICKEWFHLRCLDKSIAKQIDGDPSFSFSCKNCLCRE